MLENINILNKKIDSIGINFILTYLDFRNLKSKYVLVTKKNGIILNESRMYFTEEQAVEAYKKNLSKGLERLERHYVRKKKFYEESLEIMGKEVKE